MIDNDDRAGFDPKVMIDAFNASAQELRDQNLIVMREMMQTQGRALEFESFTTAVQPGQVTQLVGFDLSRMKLKLHAQGSGVYVGKRSQIASGYQGYRLPSGSDVEFAQVGELYAMLSAVGAQNNLKTNPGPSSTTGITSTIGGTYTLAVAPDTRFPSGSAATLTFTVAPTASFNIYLGGGSNVSAGAAVSASTYLSADYAGGNGELRLVYYDGVGNYLGQFAGPSVPLTAGGVRIGVSGTVPQNATSVSLFVGITGTPGAVGNKIALSSTQIEEAKAIGPYFDGNTNGYFFLSDGTSQSLPKPVPVSVWVEKNAQ